MRKQILDAGRSMLLDEGFSQISMRKIAREIDVSATSIYLHFKNKDHLIHALIEEGIEALYRTIESISRSEETTPRKIERIARSYVAFGLDRPQEYEVIFLLRPDEMPRYPKEKFRKAREIFDLISGVIRQGLERGEIETDEPMITAYTFWAQLHGVVSILLNKRLDNRIPQNKFINQSLVRIVDGLCIKPQIAGMSEGAGNNH